MEDNRCKECKIELVDKKKGARFCSPKCRVTFSRKESLVTDSVTLSEPIVTEKFSFTTAYSRKPGDQGYDQATAESSLVPRTATYWYDVPIAAVPVLQEGWPDVPNFGTKEKPNYMNGRQYFLWWKNEFKMKDGKAVIHNPFPIYDKLEYVKAGEGSRHWGTV